MAPARGRPPRPLDAPIGPITGSYTLLTNGRAVLLHNYGHQGQDFAKTFGSFRENKIMVGGDKIMVCQGEVMFGGWPRWP